MASPPPYSDKDNGPPHQGYGPQHQSYGPPPQGYRPRHRGYGPPPQVYGPPPEGYGPPPLGYGPPHQGYGHPPHGYVQPPHNSPVVVVTPGPSTTIVQKAPINHLLHLIITIFFPFWIFVWILICICD